MDEDDIGAQEETFFNASIYQKFGFGDRIARDDEDNSRQNRSIKSSTQQSGHVSARTPNTEQFLGSGQGTTAYSDAYNNQNGEGDDDDDLFIENDLSDNEGGGNKQDPQGQPPPPPGASSRTEDQMEIKSLRIDLHDWCTYLGEFSSRWNSDTGKQEPEFIRNPECVLSLRKIRKYAVILVFLRVCVILIFMFACVIRTFCDRYLQDDLDNDVARIARWLGEWRIVERKILPLMSKYEEDT